MDQFSIVDTAKLTAVIEGGGFKRQATKDSAVTAFNEAAKAKGLKLAANWATGLSAKEASDKLRDMLAGKEPAAPGKKAAAPKKGKTAPAPKVKNGAKGKVAAKKQSSAKGGGRHGNRDTKLIVVAKANPYKSGQSKTTFEQIMKSPGKTFRDYVKAGGRANTIAHAIREGHLKLDTKSA